MRTTTPAYVLRRVRWSESSLILTLYSLDFGRISAVARGALRPKSPFYGQVELLSGIDLTILRKDGRELDTIIDVTVLKHFESIRSDPPAFAHSCLFAEWMLGAITGSEPSQPMYHLFGNVLSHFASGAPFWPVLCSGIEKMLRLSGLAMEINCCTRCGRDALKTQWWDAVSGGLVCDGCRGNAQPVPIGFLRFIEKSRSGGLNGIRGLRLWPGGFRLCLELMRSFAEIHLDAKLKLKSLAVVEDLENDYKQL